MQFSTESGVTTYDLAPPASRQSQLNVGSDLQGSSDLRSPQASVLFRYKLTERGRRTPKLSPPTFLDWRHPNHITHSIRLGASLRCQPPERSPTTATLQIPCRVCSESWKPRIKAWSRHPASTLSNRQDVEQRDGRGLQGQAVPCGYRRRGI